MMAIQTFFLVFYNKQLDGQNSAGKIFFQNNRLVNENIVYLYSTFALKCCMLRLGRENPSVVPAVSTVT